MPSSATVPAARRGSSGRCAGSASSRRPRSRPACSGPAVLDQRRGDRRRGVHAHEDDDGAAQPAERRPVDQRLRMPGRQVPGDDDELVGQPAVGDRDAGQARARAIALVTPGHHLDRRRPRPRTPRTSSMPRPKTNGSPPLSRTTRLPASACSTSSALICSCAIDRPRGSFEASMTSTSGGSEASSDCGARWSATTTSACDERPAPAHGDQPRIARAAARPARRCRAARRPGVARRPVGDACRRSARRRRRRGRRPPAADRRRRARR